jgi:hypothetical protein
MIRIALQIDLHYDVDEHGADFVFNIHAAHTRCQTVVAEQLRLSQPIEPRMQTDPATGTDYGADPALGPPDFHAYVEVYLGDRWYIFDPSGTAIPMGFVRVGTGRDAADVAFATIFGGVRSLPPRVQATAIEDAARGMVLPQHCDDALSTDSADLIA